MVIPPADFVGELNLSAELRNADGAALATSAMQLVWKAAAPATALVTSSPAPSSAIPAPQPPPLATPQPSLQAPPLPQTQPQQPLPQQQTIAALPTTPAPAVAAQPRADAARELSPNEIAALIRRAQELLATGDVKAARALLLRAAEAHDPRAALALAKTFDPIVSRQSTTIDAGPDLNQARTWYQRAREWGAPEAQRQLDALASYR
jgi:TPR repeat protein